MTETLQNLKDRAIPRATPDRACDQLMCQVMMNHQHCGDPPTQVHATFGIVCETVEQPYIRKLKVGKTAIPLDTGWLTKPGYMVIENQAKHDGSSSPSPVVEVVIGGTVPFVVRYGRICVVDLQDVGAISLRGTHDDIPILLKVMPR